MIYFQKFLGFTLLFSFFSMIPEVMASTTATKQVPCSLQNPTDPRDDTTGICTIRYGTLSAAGPGFRDVSWPNGRRTNILLFSATGGSRSASRPNVQIDGSKSVVVNSNCDNETYLLQDQTIMKIEFNQCRSQQSGSDAVRTYWAGRLRITGSVQHVCNVLLPRGPGIGKKHDYPDEASLWNDLGCSGLYCDLEEVDCRKSLRPQWAKPDVY
jgi:hypothetical protein